MNLKMLLSALILCFTPVLVAAQCVGEHSEASMSCADGTQWDADTASCVAPVTG